MERETVSTARIGAFTIDIVIILIVIMLIAKGLMLAGITLPIGYVMFLLIPLLFFLYWVLDINVGKKLFKIEVIDEKTGLKPTVGKYFVRCLLFSLLVSINLILLIPIFVSKKNRSFHDMMAGTLVVKKLLNSNQ
ncbi:RDD family protein [Shewanella glacialimarina]|jgi:uncharacterized RDD family membrane protein YckC|uniref:RDD family protein n=1 Tax=Shewanella glacialimarina TaxID=2590884 RepID=UPI001CF8DC2F|nr:RDD family protein [Shewanella glacialimarina]UCX05631.1 hypothetical protein FJ709_14750 [Shewanella glacialimarina]